MPRRQRVFVDGAIYHVYCRVTRGERVFADEGAAAAFVGVVRDVKRRDGLTIFAWCLMPNHYHLVLRTGELPLWRSMCLIQGRFAKRFNRRSGFLGPLWQGRYKTILVLEPSYLERLIAYVHLNPVSAGLVDDPAQWRLSGHRELLGKEREPLVDVDDALVLFGSERRAARRAYVKVVKGDRAAAWIGEAPGRLPWWPRAVDEEVSPRSGRPYVDALGGSVATDRPRLRVEAFLALVSGEEGVGVAELGGRGKGGALTEYRELVALLAVEAFGVKVKELASRFGMNPGSVSRWVTRGGRRRMAEPVADIAKVSDLDRAPTRHLGHQGVKQPSWCSADAGTARY